MEGSNGAILLMETTRNPGSTHQVEVGEVGEVGDVFPPVIYKVWTTSQVVQDFFLQLSHDKIQLI